MMVNFSADTFQDISFDIECWVENDEIWNYDYVDIRITKDKHGWQATATIDEDSLKIQEGYSHDARGNH